MKLIGFNYFRGMKNLNILNLKSNQIQTIESFSFESNKNLEELNLAYNSIRVINSNVFNGFSNLKVLDLLANPLEKLEKNSFNNTTIKRIIVSIGNITAENVCIFKNELKPIQVKQAAHLVYYDPIYIENRVDIDCTKTYLLMKSKILYNFLFDYDMDNYFLDCKYNSQLKNADLKYKCDAYNTNLNQMKIDKTWILIIVFIFIVFVYLFSLLIYFYLNCKLKLF
jgi:hypothetical protein